MRGMIAWGLFIAVGAVMLSAPGCSKKRPGELPVYTVKGRVTHKGEPMPFAVVTFFRTDQPFAQALKSRATADAEGYYELTTYELKDGAPEGEYAVVLYVPTKPPGPNDMEVPNPPDKLNHAYIDPAKPKLRFSVKPEPNTIDIKLP